MRIKDRSEGREGVQGLSEDARGRAPRDVYMHEGVRTRDLRGRPIERIVWFHRYGTVLQCCYERAGAALGRSKH